jgi:hypothetical protein
MAFHQSTYLVYAVYNYRYSMLFLAPVEAESNVFLKCIEKANRLMTPLGRGLYGTFKLNRRDEFEFNGDLPIETED